jgi:hypothetical protein
MPAHRYEWVVTDSYDASSPTHQRIKKDIEVGDGLPDITDAQAVRGALAAEGAAAFTQRPTRPPRPISLLETT